MLTLHCDFYLTLLETDTFFRASIHHRYSLLCLLSGVRSLWIIADNRSA